MHAIKSLLVTAGILALIGMAGAQTPGHAPVPIDGYASAQQMNGGTGGCTANSNNCVNFTDGVANDDLIVCGASQEHIAGPGIGCAIGVPVGNDPPWTFTDTLSSTWNMQTSTSVSPTNTFMQMGYACVTANSTYRVNWTGAGGVCQTSFQCTRFKNVCHSGAALVDGAIQSAASGAAAGLTTTNTSNTTTRTGDLIVAVGTHTNATGGGTAVIVNGTPPLAMTVDDTGMDQLMAWQLAPTLGANSSALAGLNGNGGQQIVMQTLAFKLPIIVADTVMPQGAIGTAYSAQLHCPGSLVSAPTYTLASGSLPTGLTLHGATGIIDGTPSGSPSTVTLGFTCTDGTNTSATDTLSLQVGSTFNSITIGAVSSGDLSLQPVSFTLTASCGAMISIRAMADDTHNGQGYLQPITGTFGTVSDSAGSPVQFFLVNGGVNIAPVVEWVLGPLPVSGTDTITVANGTGSSSGLHYYASVINGAQPVLDVNTSNSVAATANGTLAASYTTVVPNQYVEVTTATTGNSSTITYSAPFTLDLSQATPGVMAAGHDLVSSASTVTATANISEPSAGCSAGGGFNFCDSWSTLVTAFRPALFGSCSFTGTGEKKRRSMN